MDVMPLLPSPRGLITGTIYEGLLRLGSLLVLGSIFQPKEREFHLKDQWPVRVASLLVPIQPSDKFPLSRRLRMFSGFSLIT